LSRVKSIFGIREKIDVDAALLRQYNDSDTIFVCFPKCGSTWLEVILTQYLFNKYDIETLGIRDIHRVTKQLEHLDIMVRTHDDDPHLKTVEQYETDKSKYKNKKVILLVRDPRDILISYYFEYTKKKEYLAAGVAPFLGTPDEFLHYPIGGIRAIIAFLNLWADNYNTPKDFHLVKYEDLHENTSLEIRNILAFIGETNIDEEALTKAIDFSKFDNMRKLEEKGVAGLRLNPHVEHGDTEGYKTRKGQVGGYKNYLSPNSCAKMEAIISQELSPFFESYKNNHVE
jgi:hypothetical protein